MKKIEIDKKTMSKWSIDILADIVGGILIAAGAYNFAAAAEFPLVGVNGIALIFHHLMGLPIGVMAIVLNIPIAIVCYKMLGKDFFFRSIRSMIITSLIIDVAAPLLPVYEGDRMLAAICTGVLSGIGYALIYLRDSSTGGTDFIILSIKSKKPHLSIGKISFALEAIIIFLGTITVSRQMDALIYGMLISYIMSAVMDKVMYGISSGKMTLIVTRQPKEVAARISQVAGRGATFLKGKGSFDGEEKDVVMCACSNKQMFSIRKAAMEVDPDAFLIILESNEVVGEGFQEE